MTKEELLSRLDEAETNEEIAETGRELLALDPESPYGKLAVWETMEYEEAMQNLDMLREALDKIRAVVEAREIPALVDDDRDALVYATVMMNLGFSLLAEGETEEAYEVAKEFANFDDEGAFESRTLLYRTMLDLGLYKEILDTLEADPLESVVGEHARAIALLETGAEHDEIFDAINYAISLSPDVPSSSSTSGICPRRRRGRRRRDGRAERRGLPRGAVVRDRQAPRRDKRADLPLRLPHEQARRRKRDEGAQGRI